MTTNHHHNDPPPSPPPPPFVEIRPQSDDVITQRPPDHVEAYVASPVQPRHCGPLIKELASLLPLRSSSSEKSDDGHGGGGVRVRMSLGHMKRVRRRAVEDVGLSDGGGGEESTAKKAMSEVNGSPPPSKSEERASEKGATGRMEAEKSGSAAAHTEDGVTPPTETKDQVVASPPRKKKKKKRHNNKVSASVLLEVVLGSVSDVDALPSTDLSRLISRYDLRLEKRTLPGRSAESKEEMEKFNDVWPTIYFHKKSSEHREEELTLTVEEMDVMKFGMAEAIRDAEGAREQWLERRKMHSECCGGEGWSKKENGIATNKSGGGGKFSGDGRNVDVLPSSPPKIGGAIVLCPQTGTVVSRSCDERSEQMRQSNETAGTQKGRDAGGYDASPPYELNPLGTPVLLAIQGVSRRERMAALGQGMESDEFKNGQYLCTGYDMYTTIEPGIFEAMAMVHSRIRRVTFGVPDSEGGGLGGTGIRCAVHSLPGTNHHYRAFRCNEDGLDTTLLEQCRRLHPGEKVDKNS